MARNRRKSPSTTDNTQTTNGTERQGIKMAGMSADQIAQLLGKTRQKGVYTDKLNEFVQSGEMGVCANEQWVEFADKKSATLKQGFEAAKDKKEAIEGADQVKVIVSDEKVYLVNIAVAAEQGLSTPESVAA